MKSSLIAVIFLFSITLFAQEDKLQNIKQTYKKDFPGIENALWEKTEYGIMAVVPEEGCQIHLIFYNDGKLKEVCVAIDEHELPESVWDALLTGYSDCKTGRIERVERSGSIFYRVELDNRIRETESLFDEDGLLVSYRLK